MFSRLTGDKWLGLIAIIFALVLVLVWVPLDTETGLIEKVRRQVTLGDGLGPTVAGVVILLGGVLTFFNSDALGQTLDAGNLKWLGWLLASIACGLVLMRYSGPLITGLLTDQSYRALRATPPWNYIGYIIGGMVLVAALITLVGGKLRPGAVLVGLLASLIIALLYDLPFDDLQLPPNGDV